MAIKDVLNDLDYEVSLDGGVFKAEASPEAVLRFLKDKIPGPFDDIAIDATWAQYKGKKVVLAAGGKYRPHLPDPEVG